LNQRIRHILSRQKSGPSRDITRLAPPAERQPRGNQADRSLR
jgi:hypothetical protein